jgi:hypothetical protein
MVMSPTASQGRSLVGNREGQIVPPLLHQTLEEKVGSHQPSVEMPLTGDLRPSSAFS